MACCRRGQALQSALIALEPKRNKGVWTNRVNLLCKALKIERVLNMSLLALERASVDRLGFRN